MLAANRLESSEMKAAEYAGNARCDLSIGIRINGRVFGDLSLFLHPESSSIDDDSSIQLISIGFLLDESENHLADQPQCC